jgi:hypothetical protein
MRYRVPIGSWPLTRNLRWARTLSHLAGATCITEFTSAVAGSFTTPDSCMVCAADRWKKFLSIVSHRGNA